MTLDVPTGIHLGDTRSLAAGLPAESVNLIVTSAPYPGRAGGVHPDEFVAWWMPFADQFWRVLHSSGSLVLNIREPCINGERHTCVLSLIVAMRYRGWLWVDEYLLAQAQHQPWPVAEQVTGWLGAMPALRQVAAVRVL